MSDPTDSCSQQDTSLGKNDIGNSPVYLLSRTSYWYIGMHILIACFFTSLVVQQTYSYSYFLFFSALSITVFSDMHTMLISRYVTLYLLPFIWLCGWFSVIPLTLFESLIGAFSAYIVLWGTAKIFYIIKKQDGLGQGDIDLLTFIGACIGIVGWWATLLIGSCMASLCGLLYIAITGQSKNIRLPFGPFLAVGAMLYVLCEKLIMQLLFI